MAAKPIFILHAPRVMHFHKSGQIASVAETLDLFREFLEKEIGSDYHVIVLPLFNEVNFRTECYFVENLDQKTIDEINTKIKNHYENVRS